MQLLLEWSALRAGVLWWWWKVSCGTDLEKISPTSSQVVRESTVLEFSILIGVYLCVSVHRN